MGRGRGVVRITLAAWNTDGGRKRAELLVTTPGEWNLSTKQQPWRSKARPEERSAVRALGRWPTPTRDAWPHHHRARVRRSFPLRGQRARWPDDCPDSRSTSFSFFFFKIYWIIDYRIRSPTDQAGLPDPHRAPRAQSPHHSTDLRASLRHPDPRFQADAPAVPPGPRPAVPPPRADGLRPLALHAGRARGSAGRGPPGGRLPGIPVQEGPDLRRRGKPEAPAPGGMQRVLRPPGPRLPQAGMDPCLDRRAPGRRRVESRDVGRADRHPRWDRSGYRRRPRGLVLPGVRPGNRAPRPARVQDRSLPAYRQDARSPRRIAVRLPRRGPGARGTALALLSRLHARYGRPTRRPSRPARAGMAPAPGRPPPDDPRAAPGAP